MDVYHSFRGTFFEGATAT